MDHRAMTTFPPPRSELCGVRFERRDEGVRSRRPLINRYGLGNGRCLRHPVRGVTLIELIVTIAIVAAAAAALLGTMTFISKSSGDSMAARQAEAIANAYLDEALSKSFFVADAVPEVARNQFDDVSDYNGLNDNGARDQSGNAILNLGQYTVTMQVSPGALGAPALPAVDVWRVDVTVRHSSGLMVMASGYRTRY
jgi:MSHA pilin protein MshD